MTILFVKYDTATGKFKAGSGGGGGSGHGGVALWRANDPDAPIPATENDLDIELFEDGAGQILRAAIKIPKTYVAGNQIKLIFGMYSPSASNTILLKTVTTLIREATDATDSTTNQHSSGNSALTNTVANQYREVTVNLTDASGEVNAVAVGAGDLLKVELQRGTGTDAADIRFIPDTTEIDIG